MCQHPRTPQTEQLETGTQAILFEVRLLWSLQAWQHRPLLKQHLAQVGKLGPAYHSWVHKPVPGAPRFFASPWLEAITKTPWCDLRPRL